MTRGSKTANDAVSIYGRIRRACIGSSRPAPTYVAAMKFNRNGLPIVGTVEKWFAVFS
jgi:hypothetical protein